MSQTATKDDLKILKNDLKNDIRNLGSNLRDEIRENTRDIISHVNKGMGTLRSDMNSGFNRVDQQFVEVNTKLEAIMSGEVLVTREEHKKLVSTLRHQGIRINE